jgi:hypothetical protein
VKTVINLRFPRKIDWSVGRLLRGSVGRSVGGWKRGPVGRLDIWSVGYLLGWLML